MSTASNLLEAYPLIHCAGFEPGSMIPPDEARLKNRYASYCVRIPNSDRAVVASEKIESYLLSPGHAVGRHKAAFFRSLGYTQENSRRLEQAILRLVSLDATLVSETTYGTKYEIRSTITGPNGRSAAIVTAWIVLNDEGFPRFVTAYPRD